MKKVITIPKGYDAKIEGDKVVFFKKESEDERTRKEIVKYLTNEVNGIKQVTPRTAEFNAWMRYLEKQKYKEKYDRLAPIYADQESFESALDKAWKFYNDSGSSTVDGCEDNAFELAFAKGFREGFLHKKSQKERTLVPKFKVGDCIYDKRDSYNRNVIREVGKDYYINAFAQKMDMAYTDANFEFLEHLDKYSAANKPAEWREEDEGLIDLAVAAVEDFYDKKNPIRVEIIKFLKFLRPQPKQEWSEEDEDRMNSIVNWLAANGSKKFSGFKAFELLDWLKSLRPQPHWKPSEEQMKALKDAIEILGYMVVANTLRELCTDLEKL